MIEPAHYGRTAQRLEADGFAANSLPANGAKPYRAFAGLAMGISVAVHPLLLPTFWIWLAAIFHLLPLGVRPGAAGWLIAFLFISTFLLPVLGIALARQLGIISGWRMQSRRDRLYAMFFTAGVYIGCTLLTTRAIPGTVMVNRLLAMMAAMVAVTALINLFYRISAHTIASSTYAGFWLGIAFLTGPSLHAPAMLAATELAILATGLVAWARLYLNAHSPQQIVWGAVVGFGSGMGISGWYFY